jgi:mono/diheme cytochrome c family protein
MTRTLFTKWPILALCGGLLLAAGCSSDQAAPPSPSVDPQSAGYQVYAGKCAGCHGADLQGRSGPNLTQVGARLSKEQIADRIKNGGRGMPAFQNKLDDSQVNDLVDWLSQRK